MPDDDQGQAGSLYAAKSEIYHFPQSSVGRDRQNATGNRGDSHGKSLPFRQGALGLQRI